MQRIGISALALAIGFVAAPRVEAQSRVMARSSSAFVCRDGQVVSSAYGSRACDGHGGIDATATARLRGNAVSRTTGNRGVYNGNGGASNGTRGVYRGGTNGGVYNGGVYYPNGTVNGRRGDQRQANGRSDGRRNDDGENENENDDNNRNNGRYGNNGHGRGHAYGHANKDHHDNGRRGHD